MNYDPTSERCCNQKLAEHRVSIDEFSWVLDEVTPTAAG